jgi:hypothetical protein
MRLGSTSTRAFARCCGCGACARPREWRLALHGLLARFGPVRMQTTLGNIASAELTGPYRWYKAIGIRQSWVDHGLTLGSTAAGGVCIRFRAPVRGLGRRARHPGLTVTVQDRELLQAVLNRLIGHSAP